jgi:multidrug efflux pump subunit AcrA (membrane-fusion protein)
MQETSYISSSPGLKSAPSASKPGALIRRLIQFEGSAESYVPVWLEAQCSFAGASAGALLSSDGSGQLVPLAMHPAPQGENPSLPEWLARGAAVALQAAHTGQARRIPLPGRDEDFYAQAGQRCAIIVPIYSELGASGAGVYDVTAAGPEELNLAQERLELTSTFPSRHAMRLKLDRRQQDLEALQAAMETLTALNSCKRFQAAAMALCNELTARFHSEHVGLGMLRGRYVHLKTLSHTEEFSRKMKIVQHMEAAMEECFDQDLEIVYPPDDEATYTSRATRDLSKKEGPSSILSLPIRYEKEVVGVLTLTRSAEDPWQHNEMETLRLTCDLMAARLVEIYQRDRWFGARLANWIKKGLAMVLSPRHTWAKLAAIGIVGFVLFALLVKGEDYVQSSFSLDATQRQVVAAGLNTRLDSIRAEVGQEVKAGQTLATLDVIDLELERGRLQAERLGYLTEAAIARKEGEHAKADIANAKAAQAQAELKQIAYKISLGKLQAPLDGTIVTGDLHRRLNSDVQRGDVLYEIAPLQSLRADLLVPEDRIVDVRLGMKGELATASYPDRKVGFTVERINPEAEAINQDNVFRVRVRLDLIQPWMRPGMEGVARIHVGRSPYAWLWTRRLVNWVRMKLWI